MDPSDVALLLVLGTADERATPLAQICSVARLIAPRDWQPTTEVIGAAAERAIRDALVVIIDDGGDDGATLETTALGRRQAAALLCKPIPRTSGSFMRACMSVKLRFLHLLPQPGRCAEIAALAGLYRDAIDFVRRLQHLAPSLAGPALQDLRCELLRLESEAA